MQPRSDYDYRLVFEDTTGVCSLLALTGSKEELIESLMMFAN